MATGFSRNASFSKRLDISAELFYWSKAVEGEVSRYAPWPRETQFGAAAE
jgi:hypothetical protein